MNEQPKPVSGEILKDVKENSPYPMVREHAAKALQPEPATGEWTAETVKFWDFGQIADAHNTALAAVTASAITQLDQAYARGAAAEREKYKIPGGTEVDPASIPQQPPTEEQENVNRLENALVFADKTNSGLHRIITGHANQIEKLEQQLATEKQRTEEFARAQAKANARLCEIEGEHQKQLATERKKWIEINRQHEDAWSKELIDTVDKAREKVDWLKSQLKLSNDALSPMQQENKQLREQLATAQATIKEYDDYIEELDKMALEMEGK